MSNPPNKEFKAMTSYTCSMNWDKNDEQSEKFNRARKYKEEPNRVEDDNNWNKTY